MPATTPARAARLVEERGSGKPEPVAPSSSLMRSSHFFNLHGMHMGGRRKLHADVGADQLALLMEGSPSMSSLSNVSRPRSQDTYRSPRVRKQACAAHTAPQR